MLAGLQVRQMLKTKLWWYALKGKRCLERILPVYISVYQVEDRYLNTYKHMDI